MTKSIHYRADDTAKRILRNKAIWRELQKGTSIPELASVFKVSKRLVNRVKEYKGDLPYKTRVSRQVLFEQVLHDVDLTGHFKLAQPPSIADPGYKIYLKECPHCTGDVEFYAPALSAKCLQCSRRWGRAS